MTMGATASPAIRLRVSLARTQATLASKRPTATEAAPSAQLIWKKPEAMTPVDASADAYQGSRILEQHGEQGGIFRALMKAHSRVGRPRTTRLCSR